jgi:molybdate transport system substrate-binding protein
VVLATLLLSGACATQPGGASQTAGVTQQPATVRVAAASDLRFAMAEIEELLAQSDAAMRVDVTYGSSGTFYQQLLNGAPFDLYLSADLSYPQDLVDTGLADDHDLFEYGVGRLVVWAPASSPVDPTVGLSALTSEEVRHVAIANPEHAPYGTAAVAAMKSAGVFEAVAGKLVLGENVSQAAEFVQSGAAEIGLIALSLALSPQMTDAGSWVEVPLDTYPLLRQGGVVLDSAQDPAAARTVRDVIVSEEGRAVLARYGFTPPEG